jgi:pyruvate dehydrogenase E2 component (dihydrolipoamide acetyltransferase)
MPVEFKMPDPGEGIHEAEVLEIHVAEGDRVEEGQTVMEVETDKASVEVPSPVTGKVKEIRVKVGDIVEVGDVLMVFLEEGEEESGEEIKEKKAEEPKPQPEEEKEDEKETAAAEEKEEQEKPEAKEEAPEKGRRKKEEAEKKDKESEAKKAPPPQKAEAEDRERRGPVPATPATRRLARELDVALEQVEASGPGGRVTPEDVKAHAEGPKQKPEKEKAAAAKPPADERHELPDFGQWGEVERTPLRSVRRTTAKRMALSWSEVPQVTHEDVADITDLERLRKEHKNEIEKQGGALTLTVFAIKAAVAALKAYPRFNASLDIAAREIILKKYFHIGVAVDTDRGLLVPVVRDADCKSMLELAREVYELAERTRQGELEPKDMTGGTFTITNVGPLGGTGFTPIINYPQVAILGLARARLQPVVRGQIDDFKVAARLMLPLCMGFDHRIVDGADAARFMGEIIRLLESPESLMLSQ